MQLSHFVILLSLCGLCVDAIYCRRPSLLTEKFCDNPPVDNVDKVAYTGRWYQAYVDKNGLMASEPNCVTANYTSRPDSSIGVLNCYSNNQTVEARCLFARARPRPNSDSPSRLLVKFRGLPFPEGSYNIAALLGDATYGYSAAAVFSCRTVGGQPESGWFFLVRDPYFSTLATRRLIRRLRCKGYSFKGVRLYRTYQGRGCKYFDGENGFKIDTSRNSTQTRPIPA